MASRSFDKKKLELINQFRGINLATPPSLLGSTSLIFSNYMFEYPAGGLTKIGGPSKIASISKPIYNQWILYVNNNRYQFILTNDGYLYTLSGTTFTQIATGFSLDMQMCATDTDIRMIDNNNGYSKWNGTTWTVVNSTVKGSAIMFYKGRVYIGAQNNYLYYSDPSNYDSFASPGGSAKLAFPQYCDNEQIRAFVIAYDTPYILRDSSVFALVTVASLYFGSNQSMPFEIKYITSSDGCKYVKSVSESYSIFFFYGLKLNLGITYNIQQIGEEITPVAFSGNCVGACGYIQTLPVYVCYFGPFNFLNKTFNGIFIYSIVSKKWFYCDTGFNVTSIAYDSNNNVFYATDDNGNVYNLFSNLTGSSLYFTLVDDITAIKEIFNVGISVYNPGGDISFNVSLFSSTNSYVMNMYNNPAQWLSGTSGVQWYTSSFPANWLTGNVLEPIAVASINGVPNPIAVIEISENTNYGYIFSNLLLYYQTHFSFTVMP